MATSSSKESDDRRIKQGVEKRSNDSLGANKATSGGSGDGAGEDPAGEAF